MLGSDPGVQSLAPDSRSTQDHVENPCFAWKAWRAATREHASMRVLLVLMVASMLHSHDAFSEELQLAERRDVEEKLQKYGGDSDSAQLETVTVTGTRIKGGVTPSPVIMIDSERIREEGFTGLGEVIRALPQNFAGGQNPGVTGVASGLGNQDLTGGSALNLRGLGADASLTLLNGRRLAYDGFSQAVDISAIPVEAVERVEIIPDGASALYGSDAVGGVANVILKQEFDGVALGGRYGGSSGGGLATREYTATGGAAWASGGLIATVRKAEVDPIDARQRSYTEHLVEPYTIYGGNDTRGGLISAHQALGEVAELRLDALRTERDGVRAASASTAFHFRYRPQTSIRLVAPSVALFLPRDWTLTMGGSDGRNESIDRRYFVTATESLLVSDACNCNESRSYEVGAEGPLFALGAGQARLAIGVGGRRDEYRYDPRIAPGTYGGEERARFAYAEVSLPFVAPSSGVEGVHRLELSAAVRGEDYASFGGVTTPKLGLLYDPDANWTLKASWGKSFKAPTLLQRYQTKEAYLWSATEAGGAGEPAGATVLMSYGGNSDLEAERARTWSASIALHPESMPGFETELTWFDIDYTDRVVEPVNYLQALSNPVYAPYVDRAPTTEQIAQLLAEYGDAFYNFSGVGYDPANVVAIVRDQYVNAARQRIQGVDLSATYRLNVGAGGLTLRGAASWLDSTQVTGPAQPEQPLAGTAFNPAKLKGRVGAVWVSGGLTASGFFNYTDGVTHRTAATREVTGSFTTVDATLNYAFGQRVRGLSGVTVGIGVQNLLDRAPPLYTAAAATFVPYDATNYSAIGRFASVTIGKQW